MGENRLSPRAGLSYSNEEIPKKDSALFSFLKEILLAAVTVPESGTGPVSSSSIRRDPASLWRLVCDPEYPPSTPPTSNSAALSYLVLITAGGALYRR